MKSFVWSLSQRSGRVVKGIASIVIFTVTASVVLVVCFLDRTVVEYRKIKLATDNQTLTCYGRTEKVMFPTLLKTLLSFLGIILGTLVERLSLIAEERHHVTARYGGSRIKMFKACFRGISWGSVIMFTCLSCTVVFAITFYRIFRLTFRVYSTSLVVLAFVHLFLI